MTKKEKLAYFAGIVDGEGCIRIGRTKSKFKSHPHEFRAYIQIGVTDKSLMEWVKKNIGGEYYFVKNKTVKSKHSWNWFMNPKEGAEVLEKILPFLVIKKEQAKLFIEYAKTITPRGTWGCTGLPQELYDKREKLYFKIKKLNKKGI